MIQYETLELKCVLVQLPHSHRIQCVLRQEEILSKALLVNMLIFFPLSFWPSVLQKYSLNSLNLLMQQNSSPQTEVS